MSRSRNRRPICVNKVFDKVSVSEKGYLFEHIQQKFSLHILSVTPLLYRSSYNIFALLLMIKPDMIHLDSFIMTGSSHHIHYPHNSSYHRNKYYPS
jgi:hypothetical protein